MENQKNSRLKIFGRSKKYFSEKLRKKSQSKKWKNGFIRRPKSSKPSNQIGERALYFSETSGISILEDSLLAQPKNRIKTAATSQLSISGEGFIDLVYDADAGSDGLGRWIVIKFRG